MPKAARRARLLSLPSERPLFVEQPLLPRRNDNLQRPHLADERAYAASRHLSGSLASGMASFFADSTAVATAAGSAVCEADLSAA